MQQHCAFSYTTYSTRYHCGFTTSRSDDRKALCILLYSILYYSFQKEDKNRIQHTVRLLYIQMECSFHFGYETLALIVEGWKNPTTNQSTKKRPKKKHNTTTDDLLPCLL